MIGLLNYILREATRRPDLSAFDKERQILEADALRRRDQEAELYRRTNWRWSL